jgi:hypothetical protein
MRLRVFRMRAGRGAGSLAGQDSKLVRQTMRTLLFDDSGEIWDAKSPSLAEALQASLSGDELAKYVVRNLGFVSATESAGSVRLRLRPAVVSPTALSALFYWLHDQTIERVLISFLDGEWTHELVRSCEEAMRALLARVKFSAPDREGDFLNQPKPLRDLPDTSPLRALLGAWKEFGGKFDRERLLPVLQKAVNGRFLMVEAEPSSPSLLVREVGTGFGGDAKYWLSRTKGMRVEDQPDYAYGKWVTDLYRQVVDTREPSLQDIDAVITWPQQPRISYRYRRLVVPFANGPDSTVLLSATVMDPAIDLRVKPS